MDDNNVHTVITHDPSEADDHVINRVCDVTNISWNAECAELDSRLAALGEMAKNMPGSETQKQFEPGTRDACRAELAKSVLVFAESVYLQVNRMHVLAKEGLLDA